MPLHHFTCTVKGQTPHALHPLFCWSVRNYVRVRSWWIRGIICIWDLGVCVGTPRDPGDPTPSHNLVLVPNWLVFGSPGCCLGWPTACQLLFKQQHQIHTLQETLLMRMQIYCVCFARPGAIWEFLHDSLYHVDYCHPDSVQLIHLLIWAYSPSLISISMSCPHVPKCNVLQDDSVLALQYTATAWRQHFY